MNQKYYQVADHLFRVSADADIFALMGNYEPFLTSSAVSPAGDEAVVFTLTVSPGQAPDFEQELSQDDEGQEIVCGHTSADAPVYEFRWAGRTAGWLVCTADYRTAQLLTTGYSQKLAVDNALMVLYALSTASLSTVLFHAATVSYRSRAYMFLGKSGMGKSTHASLWLRHIAGTALVNDDNPVVRVLADGSARVYGSPWSGKTPCYRAVSYPLGGIVLLSQAPYNRIRRLLSIESYAALVPSISGKRWDTRIADGLHHTENALAGGVPVWYLECLPDEAAARLSCDTIAADSI